MMKFSLVLTSSNHSRGSDHHSRGSDRYSRDDRDRSGSGQDLKRNHSGKGGSGSGKNYPSKAKKSKPNSSRKKGTSSFMSDAFNSFLDMKAIKMVKAVGLDFSICYILVSFAFLPVPLILKLLQKLEKTTLVMILPKWLS